MDLTFRGIGPWGPGKGVNLQPGEVDNNFWAIATAILNLQDNPALPTGISSITLNGTQMTITLSNGDVMGPYTIPVLVMRWRDEWQPNTAYAQLDVFKITNLGIYLVQAAHVSGDAFDPAITVGGAPALMQIFGSADASLVMLPDVGVVDLMPGDALIWNGTFWANRYLGGMAYQEANLVNITGGWITGLAYPVNPNDAATKNYVDAVATTGGVAIPPATMIANINPGPTTPSATTLSDFLDAALGSTVTGNLIFRSGIGWVVLPPGTIGAILQTQGPGLPPAWVDSPGAGVVSITAGTGITTGGAPITSSGSVSLAVISDNTFLGNITGGANAPAGVTISQFLDHALGASRGTILTRTIAGWVALTPGTSGLYLKTQGSGNDLMWDAPPGAGTVLSVGSGTGLTGGPITSTGSLSLAAIADANVLANTSGSSAAPVPTTVSVLLDKAFGTTQGTILYRSGTVWVALTPGTSGQILTTGGAAANPAWANAPITGSSTPNLRIVSNISGSSAVPTGNTLSGILDAIISSARGTIIYRTNSGWTGLAPGTVGFVLQSGGASGDVSWVSRVPLTNLDDLADVSVFGQANRDQLIFVGGGVGQWQAKRPKYNVGCYSSGLMSANQNLLFHRFSTDVSIPANFAAYLGHGVQAGSSTLPTASTTITLARSANFTPMTFTNVASITFLPTGVITYSAQAIINFALGDTLRLRGPATPDATFADFHLTLVGYET